jgi:TIR domain
MPKRAKNVNRLPREVFLSHAHQDEAVALALAADLRRHDVPVWLSERHITPSRRWLEEIGQALDRCDWFVIVLTPAAVTSLWVQREVYFALEQKRYGGRIVPLLVKKCNVKKLAWPLTAIQMIDFDACPAGLRDLLAMWGIAYRPA